MTRTEGGGLNIPTGTGREATRNARRAMSEGENAALPFPAIVGHAWAKTALLLLAVEPRLGGVLIAAGAGTGKSTLARSFHALQPLIIARDCPLSCDPTPPATWCADCRNKLPPPLHHRDERTAAQRAGDGEGPGVRFAPPPFVELPLSATEDHVIGGLDLDASLRRGQRVAAHGLLALANRGVLAVEDINLLDTSLANLLLAAMGRGRVVVEREGIARDDPAAFALIGTYDPAEGALRPLLADRVGLLVAPREEPTAADRVAIVRRVEAFRADPTAFRQRYADEENALRAAIIAARARLPRVQLNDERACALAEMAAACAVQGNRADLFAARAACAAAALAGRDTVNDDDLHVAVRLVLLPRAERLPQEAPPEEPPPLPEPDAPDAPPDNPANDTNSDADTDTDTDMDTEEAKTPPPVAPTVEDLLLAAMEGVTMPDDVLVVRGGQGRRGAAGSRGATESRTRGRVVGVVSGKARDGRVAIAATLRAAAPHQHERGRVPGGRPLLATEDVRLKRYRDKAGTLFIFCVDASGSMALNRMRQAKGAVTHLLGQAYIHRDRVALIAFRGSRADLLLPPSQGVERAKRALDVLPTGGGTPLAAALVEAHHLASQAQSAGTTNVLLVCITDGRGNVPLGEAGASQNGAARRGQAQDEARTLAARWRASGWESIVIDTQVSYTSRGEAHTLARHLGGRYLYLPGANARDIAGAVTTAADATRAR